MKSLFGCSRWLQIMIAIGVIGAWAANSFAAQDVASLLKSAASGAPQERYAAIDDLGQLPDGAAEIVPQLQKLLSDADPQVRWRSARSLGDFGELAKGTAADLRKLLADKETVVVYHAAISLGKVGDNSEETTQALIKAATSKDAGVARAAIAALRELKPGPEKTAAAMAEVLKNDDQAVQLYALEAITEMEEKAAPLLNEALKRPETVLLATTAIEHIGPEAKATVPALTELVKSTKHSQLLIHAMLALASIGPDARSAESVIVPHLESKTDVTVPVAAAFALGSIGAKNADAPLKKAAAKDNAFLQMVAAWALAKIHPQDSTLMKQAVDKLVAGLGNKNPQLRTAAAKGLDMLDPPPALLAPPLMKIANDPDPDVSANAANALAGLGESIVPRASKALEDPAKRKFAVRVLRQMGPKAKGAVDALVKSMSGGDPDYLADVHFALAAIGPAAAPAASKLGQAVSSENQAVRESALYALRQIGPGAQPATSALVKVLAKKDSFDALAAAWALARVAPKDAKAAAEAVPVLTAGLENAEEINRLESAAALAAFGPTAKAAAPALKEAAANDRSAEVRAAAAAALKSVGA